MLKIKFKLNKNILLDDVQKLTNNLEKFSSDIYFHYSNQQANCKSLINLLAIGILNIKDMCFVITGIDEEKAQEYLKEYFNAFTI